MVRPVLRPLLLALVALASILASPPGTVPARADDDGERARRALERGEIRPLDAVLAAARAAVPGDVVALDLKRDDGRWLYKLRILGTDGRRRDVKIDASSLKLLDVDDDD
ncbi:peptidase [Methylobacterium sp. NI91]|nr:MULTISPECIES: PepSY domain-containing protein [unclassified Methylobacterium]QIJ77817.1 peptidase [Methylobacterium sp. CLZ]QIJ82717.1 peptidase [Methylobacterium sp. NI91]